MTKIYRDYSENIVAVYGLDSIDDFNNIDKIPSSEKIAILNEANEFGINIIDKIVNYFTTFILIIISSSSGALISRITTKE